VSRLGEVQNGENGVPTVIIVRVNVRKMLFPGLYPRGVDIVDIS